MTDIIRRLAEGRVSPAVDVYEVYKALFLGQTPPEAHEPYCRPEVFFKITYLTPAFVQYLSDFLAKLARGEPEVYVMPAYLGAGKSHFLALLLHVLKLYRECRGSGDCVTKALRDLGVELNAPSLPKAPEVLVYHGEHSTDFKPLDFANKDSLRRSLKPPVVVIFDETQHFEAKTASFPLLMQMLAEVVAESRGAYLFVSFSLFPGERPETAASKSFDAVRRVHHVVVALDVVKNIVEVFRKWAGLTPKRVDLAALRGVVGEDKLADFERRVSQSYPFNPLLLDALRQLAEESLIERTRVQLTRELLRTLARTYLGKRGELAVFADMPEPGEVIVVGGDAAAVFRTLLELYTEDVKRVEGNRAAVSVLRQIFLSTFFSQLLPQRRLLPAEDDVILGNYDGGEIRPLDVRNFLARIGELGVHVERVGDRYMYWVARDVASVVREAMGEFGEEDGLEVATDEVANMARERSGQFSVVVVSGVGGPKAYGKVKVVSNRDEWERELRDGDRSALAVDLMNFGVSTRRNNLVVVKRDDDGEPVAADLLKRVGEQPRNVRESAVALGRVIKAVDKVLGNLPIYFPELHSENVDDVMRREMEQMFRARLSNLKELAKARLREAASRWLRVGVLGLREVVGKNFEDVVASAVRDKRDRLDSAVRQIFEGELVQWDGFKKVGDLWSLLLNNEKFQAVPASFDEFIEAVRSFCAGCACLFEVEGQIRWIGEGGCAVPELDKDVGVAPFMWRHRVVEWAVEAFLSQFKPTPYRRYYVVYKRPSGEEVRRSIEELLADRRDWLYLAEGRLYVEEVKKGIVVRVDGVETTQIERSRGERMSVEVEGTMELAEVKYKLGALERVETVSGRRHVFELLAPEEPGDYLLEVEAVFIDGSTDKRGVYVRVRGRCKKREELTVVGAGTVISGVRAITVQDGRLLLQYFKNRGIPFRGSLAAQSNDAGLQVKLDRFGAEEVDKVLRLLRAVEEFTQSAEVTVEFQEPMAVDQDMESRFRGLKAVYVVEKEAEC